MYPHANDLYFNILRMCPHNEARAGFEHLFETAKAAGEPDNELCAMLAFRLVDALRYGNWPSVPFVDRVLKTTQRSERARLVAESIATEGTRKLTEISVRREVLLVLNNATGVEKLQNFTRLDADLRIDPADWKQIASDLNKVFPTLHIAEDGSGSQWPTVGDLINYVQQAVKP